MQQRVLQLEEHCRVLEQLLESRNAEVEVLRAESARQARELEQLREAARALPPAEGADEAPAGGSWVDFGSPGGQGGAAQPQPAFDEMFAAQLAVSSTDAHAASSATPSPARAVERKPVRAPPAAAAASRATGPAVRTPKQEFSDLNPLS